MGCSGGSGNQMRRTLPVSSDGTTTAQFIPFFSFSVAEWAEARLSIILEGGTGLVTLEAAVRYGDDQADLPAATPVDFPTTGTPTSLTANGAAYGSAYRALDASKQLAEAGLKVKNTSGTLREMGQATLIIDFKS